MEDECVHCFLDGVYVYAIIEPFRVIKNLIVSPGNDIFIFAVKGHIYIVMTKGYELKKVYSDENIALYLIEDKYETIVALLICIDCIVHDIYIPDINA